MVTPGDLLGPARDRADEERAGAYDFLENLAGKAHALAERLFAATAQRAAEYEGASVFVILDGTAGSLTDEKESKGLGPKDERTRRNLLRPLARGDEANSARATPAFAHKLRRSQQRGRHCETSRLTFAPILRFPRLWRGSPRRRS